MFALNNLAIATTFILAACFLVYLMVSSGNRHNFNFMGDPSSVGLFCDDRESSPEKRRNQIPPRHVYAKDDQQNEGHRPSGFRAHDSNARQNLQYPLHTFATPDPWLLKLLG